MFDVTKLWLLSTTAILLSFCTDVRVRGQTVLPQNAITVVNQTNGTMSCSNPNGANKVAWQLNGPLVVACLSFNPNYGVTCSQDTSTLIDYGSFGQHTYGCTSVDDPLFSYSASIAVLDSLTCGLPDTTEIIQGQSVTLPCAAGFTPYTYVNGRTSSIALSWAQNGSSVSALHPSVTTTSITVSATGQVLPSYECIVTVSFNDVSTSTTIATNDATVSCHTSPILIQYCPTTVSITPTIPADDQVAAGTVFTCSSDGYKTPAYSWNETESGRTATGSTFTLPSSGGPFTLVCTAEGNVTGFSNCSETVSVTGYAVDCPSDVEIVDESRGAVAASTGTITAKEGDLFTCSSTSSPTPAYHWSINGTASSTGSQYMLTTPGQYTLTCTPKIENSTLCNTAPTATITVFVIDCPSSSDLSITEATGPYNYICAASTNVAASYDWEDTVVEPSASTVSATGPTYTIPSTTPGYHTLTCTVSIAVSDVQCPDVNVTNNVTVVACPSVSISPSTVSQAIVGQTSFTCTSVDGYPTPVYSWYNGQSFLQSGQVYTVAQSGTFSLTCVATSVGSGVNCSDNGNITGTAIVVTTITAATTIDGKLTVESSTNDLRATGAGPGNTVTAASNNGATDQPDGNGTINGRTTTKKDGSAATVSGSANGASTLSHQQTSVVTGSTMPTRPTVSTTNGDNRGNSSMPPADESDSLLVPLLPIVLSVFGFLSLLLFCCCLCCLAGLCPCRRRKKEVAEEFQRQQTVQRNDVEPSYFAPGYSFFRPVYKANYRRY